MATRSLKLLSFVLVITVFTYSCQKQTTNPAAEQVTVLNPGFEDSLNHWTLETSYVGIYGMQSSPDAVRTGEYGLNFYAAQSSHYPGAPQETPWNGKIYQTITGLKDGVYTFKVYGDAVGVGMYIWANGGTADVKQSFKSDIKNELNKMDFTVVGGVAKIGFICIDANGNGSLLSPYFHADDVELWTKGLE